MNQRWKCAKPTKFFYMRIWNLLYMIWYIFNTEKRVYRHIQMIQQWQCIQTTKFCFLFIWNISWSNSILKVTTVVNCTTDLGCPHTGRYNQQSEEIFEIYWYFQTFGNITKYCQIFKYFGKFWMVFAGWDT